jgi:ABC-type antimicrobial peptide transport system permease subunit
VGSVRSLFPEGYVIANITDVWSLYPSTRGLYNAVLLSDRVEGAVSLPSMVDFFGLSSEEVASDIYLIYAISFLSVFFLTNALLHLEAVRQRRTISIVRAMGGGRSVIVLSFAGKALVVSLLGSLLGTSLGIMTSYALVTYLTVTGYFEVFVPIHHLGMAFVLTMVASMASSALPIREALSVPPMGIIRGGATR